MLKLPFRVTTLARAFTCDLSIIVICRNTLQRVVNAILASALNLINGSTLELNVKIEISIESDSSAFRQRGGPLLESDPQVHYLSPRFDIELYLCL